MSVAFSNRLSERCWTLRKHRHGEASNNASSGLASSDQSLKTPLPSTSVSASHHTENDSGYIFSLGTAILLWFCMLKALKSCILNHCLPGLVKPGLQTPDLLCAALREHQNMNRLHGKRTFLSHCSGDWEDCDQVWSLARTVAFCHMMG